MKFIKKFEAFHLDEFLELINSKKTYIKKFPAMRSSTDDTTYENIIKKIKNYDVNKLIYNEKPYGIFVKPDDGFKVLIDELNEFLIEKIPDDIFFYITIDRKELNQIDFTEGIPEVIRGISFGYKLYKLVIEKLKYITTNKNSNIKAYNIWYNLMLDKELYCFTSTFESGVIHKSISKLELFSILEKLKSRNLVFDPELTEKIIELYGSMDIYTQGN